MRHKTSQDAPGGRVSIMLATALTVLLVLLRPDTVLADDGTTLDWRSNLACPSEHQVREGVIYCQGTDSTGQPVHVLVADLTASSLRFEYLMPEGASDGHEGVQACRDCNVPEWGGPAGGCFVPGDRGLFPRMVLPQAVERAEEVRPSPAVVAVVNGDYGAPDGTHGPEGLVVVRGERLDGAERCDDDYNAALRPWLGLGETVDPLTGRLPATIDRLETDGSPVPDWLYAGIGGGPWLVRDGDLYPGAENCQTDYQLERIDPVMNCTGTQKETPDSPQSEGYGSGSCRAAPHTAAGLSRDGRWLFLAVSTGADRPDVLADFMRNQLGAWNALKFDGGGSSQLWFRGASEIKVDPLGEQRALSNFLALYAPSGQGVLLPLQATPVERVYYKVLVPGEEAEFTLQVRNSGAYSWMPEDGVALRLEPIFVLSPLVDSMPLSSQVSPGEIATWEWQAGSGGLAFWRLQMVQKGEPFGIDMAVVLITLPEGMEDRRQAVEAKIQTAIDEWEAGDDQGLDRLIDELRKLLERELQKLWERLLAELERLVRELIEELLRRLEQTCQGVTGTLVVATFVVIGVRQRRGRGARPDGSQDEDASR